MNCIFRTLWSVATQSWQAVPETAKSAGKGGGKRASKSSASGMVSGVALGLMASGGVSAQAPPQPVPAPTQLPTGGKVAQGVATLSQTTTAQAAALTVTQSSQRAVVNWDTFNLGSAARINFAQPNAQAVTLNRVNDANPSQIFGRITAPGQVVLTNAQGIYFSPTAQVDVGGLVATTHSISDDNFMAGYTRFERNGATGKVVNDGQLNAALGGYIALLAPEVQNAGVIVAQAGTVAMATGDAITLNFAGNRTLASITTTLSTLATLVNNQHAVLAPDGQIILSAVALNKLQAGVVKNSGTLEANSLVSKGGKIVLEGDDITLTRTSKLEAKGALGGGTVLVGGDWQGSGDLRQATKVTMEAGASIDASATDRGDGGKVVLWSDVHNADSVTRVNGSIKAEAGPNGGYGGKVETSGHVLNVDDIQVSTQSTKGKAGEWLLDPYNITITDNATAQSGTGTTYNPISSATASFTSDLTSTIKASNVATALGFGNVTITTGGTAGDGNGYGDIKIASAISWNSNNNLTLTALGEIWGTGNLTRTGGGGITFNQAGDSKNAIVNGVSYNGGYSGIVSGTGSVTKTGAGTMLVSGQSTYTGATTISEGTLKIGRLATADTNSPIGVNSSLTIATGAILNVNNYSTQVGKLTGAGSITLGNLNTGSSPMFSIGGGTAASDSSDFSGVISEGTYLGIRKIGDGVQIFSGLNTYNSYTQVNAGTLKLGRASDGTNSAIGTSSGPVTINSPGTLDLNGYSPVSGKSLSLNDGTLLNSSATDVNWIGNSIGFTTGSIRSTGGGAINLTSTTQTINGRAGVPGNFTYYPLTVEGKVSLGGAAYLMANTVTFTTGSNTKFTYAPSLSLPSVSTVFQGEGDLILSPTGASPKLTLSSTNTFTGAFTVKSGVVQVSGDGALGAATNPITVNDGGSLSLNYSAPTTPTAFPRNISISGYGVDFTESGTPKKYGALDYAYASGDSYYGGTITLNGSTRFTESGGRNLNPRGTIQTNNYDFFDGNLPKLVLTNATLLGTGAKKAAIAYISAYDPTTSYTSTYGTSPTVSYQVFTDAAATTAASTPGITLDTPVFNLPTNLTGAGTYTVSYQSGLRSSTYALFATTTAKTWTVSKAHLTVTANAANKTYGDANPNLTTTVSGFVNGQILSNSGVSGSGTATTTATTTSPVGTSSITASIGNLTASNYDFTSFVDGTLTINKANLIVTPITGQSKTYGDQDPSQLTYASLTGQLVAGDTSIAGITGSLARAVGEITGNYTYSVTNLSATNYTFTLAPSAGQFSITPRPITLTATPLNKTYGNADPTLVATITAGSLGSTTVSDTLADVTGTLTRAAGENVGSYNVALGTGSKAGNYAIVYPTNNQAFSITKANLSHVTASKTYDGLNTVTFGQIGTIAGVNGETFSATAGTAGISDKNVVTAGKTLTDLTGLTLSSSNGGVASNYNLNSGLPIASSSNQVMINAMDLQITGVSAANKVYDATRNATLVGTATVTGISGDVVSASGTGVGTFADKNVGAAKAVTVTGYTLTGTDAGNYNALQPGGVRADITPKALTVTGTAVANKTYDGSTTVTLSGGNLVGVISADAAKVTLTQAGTFADKNVGTAKAVTAANTISGTEAGNYSLTQPTGLSADITAKALSVTGTAVANKTYDGTNLASLSNGSLVGVIAADVPNVTLTQAGTFADKNVGTGKSVTADNTISGTEAGNYSLTQPTGLSADVLAVASPTTPATPTTPTTPTAPTAPTAPVAPPVVLIPAVPTPIPLVPLVTAPSLTPSPSITGLTLNASPIPLNVVAPAPAPAPGPTTTSTPADEVAPSFVVAPTSAPAFSSSVTLPFPTAAAVAASPAVSPPVTSVSTSVQAVAVVAAATTSAGADKGGGSASGEGTGTLTSTSGVVVNTIRVPNRQTTGIVAVLVPKGSSSSGTGMMISLPEEATTMAAATQNTVKVSLANGASLPSWIKYLPEQKGLVLGAVPEGGLPLQVMLMVGTQRTVVQISESQIAK